MDGQANPFIVSNADVFFPRAMIHTLVRLRSMPHNEILFFVDQGRAKFNLLLGG